MNTRRHSNRGRTLHFGLVCALVLSGLMTASGQSRAAGGAFAVDDAGVDDPGSCKVEAWASFARNDDFIGAVAPACVVSLGRPVDLGVQVDRSRSGGEWGTGLSLKAKSAIVPLTDDGPFGVAIVGGVGFDLTARETAEWFVTVPVTIRIAEPFLINLNIGGLWDRIEQRSFVTWGGGFELSFAERFTLIGEVFGQGSEHPGAQLGLRYTPHEKIDFDLIYGRNLTGERANWVTFGVNLRF
ncbi:MAG: hypothetical protein WD871_06230 [Xanthobacteraceae bacterium]